MEEKTLVGRTATDVMQALVRLRTAESHMVRRRQAAQGLGESDAAALRLVIDRADDEPVTPTEIAASLGLTTSAVTSLLDRLMRVHLVETRPHHSDRRRKIVVPTRDAVAHDPVEQQVQEIVEQLSTRSRLLIADFLDRVADVVEAQER
ncbi:MULTISPECIES: MarR family winged helix-turn-helix transcriptional regulator [unclassified Agrococcus]|uniref:MarR family winged helix-turn-helix transcriptional regulator n=1 Tax=unclassified Agrococcus TaxID=2615065 RepID=UPI003606CF61